MKAEPGNPVVLTTLTLFAISSGNVQDADHWLRQVRQQPRVKPEQRNQLIGMYRERFGRMPNP